MMDPALEPFRQVVPQFERSDRARRSQVLADDRFDPRAQHFDRDIAPVPARPVHLTE